MRPTLPSPSPPPCSPSPPLSTWSWLRAHRRTEISETGRTQERKEEEGRKLEDERGEKSLSRWLSLCITAAPHIHHPSTILNRHKVILALHVAHEIQTARHHSAHYVRKSRSYHHDRAKTAHDRSNPACHSGCGRKKLSGSLATSHLSAASPARYPHVRTDDTIIQNRANDLSTAQHILPHT